jgi:hypothetical protein
VASLFTRRICEDEARDLYLPVTKLELKTTFSQFKRDKSTVLDGWTVEFFLHFFDLVSDDLLALAESIRSDGHIAGKLYSTFLALIPKINKPLTFGDYRVISLCNLVYKVLTKVIANRIKPILSRNLSVEQFGFLEG